MFGRITFAFSLVTLLAGYCNSPGCADIVLNGSFEDAGPGGSADSDLWDELAGNSPTTVSQRSTSHSRTGSASHRFFTETQGDGMAVSQSSTSTLSAGDEVHFEFWVDGTNINNNLFAFLQLQDSASWQESVSFLAFTDNQLGTFDHNQSSTIEVPNHVTGPISYFLEISYTQGSATGLQSEIWIDDVSVNSASVPEPSTSVVILTGMIASIGFSRRRRRTM